MDLETQSPTPQHRFGRNYPNAATSHAADPLLLIAPKKGGDDRQRSKISCSNFFAFTQFFQSPAQPSNN
jgi:hypothetical protein